MELDALLITGFGGIALCYILMSAAKKAKTQREGVSPIRGTDTQAEFKEYKKRTAEEPDNPRHWVQWGNALILSARQARHLSMKVHRYNEACACYAQATEVSKSYISAWVSWGVVLYELFRLQKCTDVLLLEGGHNKFRTALEIAPNTSALWKQWGDELIKIAGAVGGEQKRTLHELSQECFMKANDLTGEAVPDDACSPSQIETQNEQDLIQVQEQQGV